MYNNEESSLRTECQFELSTFAGGGYSSQCPICNMDEPAAGREKFPVDLHTALSPREAVSLPQQTGTSSVFT